MKSNWLAKLSALVTLVTVAVGEIAPVNAQHHHHDRAGHMVDDAGHHVNGYGQHTGVGVYENYGYQQPYTYQQPYVYQQPVYQQQYVQNVVPTNVVPYPIQSNVGMIANGGTIKILNPAESGGEIRYTLNGTAYSIKPGYAQTIQNDRNWTVDFGSGGTGGNVRYSLQAGTYKFKVTDAGWNLFKSQEQQARVAELAPAPAPEPELIANEPRVARKPINVSQP